MEVKVDVTCFYTRDPYVFEDTMILSGGIISSRESCLLPCHSPATLHG